MLQDQSGEHIQGFRSVHKSERPSAVSAPLDSPDVTHIDCYTDPETKKDFILWEDIQQVYEEALFVRDKTKMVPFLKGADFRRIEPSRIAAVPNVILDVVVGGELDAVNISSLQRTVQDFSFNELPQPTPPSARRNPAYIMPEEELQNYSHIEIPASVVAAPTVPPSPSQGFPVKPACGQQSDNDTTKTLPSETISRRPDAPQDFGTTITKDLMQTMESANQGDAEAQIALGDRYRKGEGVNRDREAAMDWYRRASEGRQGHARAQYNIGLLYLRTDNLEQFLKLNDGSSLEYDVSPGQDDDDDIIPRNRVKALAWFMKAAIRRLAEGQFGVAVVMLTDDNFKVRQPDREASSCIVGYSLKAAVQGLAEAQFFLGSLYKDGKCYLPKDDMKAAEWYLQAAGQGHTEAQLQLEAFCCNTSNNSGYDSDFDGSGEIKSKVKAWITKVAGEGVERAQFCMGVMCRDGRGGVSRDEYKAFVWFLKAAEQGHTNSQIEVAEMYERGRVVPTNRKKALEWYTKADQGGDPTAKDALYRLTSRK